nr:restriction endonuclease [uncultured Carboxylicivirga sp.]
MNNYDLLTLSPNEFENLIRDLLQKKLGVFIESFTTGRDGGIDLRCAKDSSKKIIIQAKRYKNLNSLLGNLKKEVKKVNDLKPDRYIVATTVGLTPNNKSEMLKLFSPYIQNTEDILGNDDIQNLISLYKDIELKYYKLWLSSSNILEKVIHSKIYNQSAFELEEIREQVRLYVQNNSFDKGLKILKEHKYVIISGIPGIGKTTLARVLTLYLLSNGFDEFVYLNDSINDGYQYYQEGKKQIFFFDDFLGKNFFESKQHPNEDNKLIKFIGKIKKSSDKVLILATREYILNQAKLSFEAFKINNIEIAKCILDLDSYTKVIKAQILYNHLFFADVPQSHLEDLVAPEKHLKIVNHPNYNPRVIETFINRKIWESCEPTEFSNAIKSYFDNPESVWLYAFENSLNKFSQYTLLVLLTMGTPVKIEHLEEAIISFLKVNQYKFQIPFDSILFTRALKELENTFIKTQKDSYNTIVVEYQNPSIQDFLVNYLRDKKDLIFSLIESSIFQEQFFTVFTTLEDDKYTTKKKILLSKDLSNHAFNKIEEKYSELRNCKAIRYKYNNSENFSWGNDSNKKYQFLDRILTEIGSHNKNAAIFVKEKFKSLIYIDDYSYSEQSSYLNLLSDINNQDFEFNEEQLIDSFLDKVYWIDNLDLFSKLSELFPTTYSDTIGDESFNEKVEELVKEEVKNVEDSDMDSLKTEIHSLESIYNLDLHEYSNELSKRIEEYDGYLDSQIDSYIEDRYDRTDYTEYNDGEIIEEIFKSLAEK